MQFQNEKKNDSEYNATEGMYESEDDVIQCDDKRMVMYVMYGIFLYITY